MKVMIVDDNASVRAMIRSILSPAVESFFECNDGSDACSSYETFQPDWVLMDIRMTHMDGFEASRKILTTDPNAKIIMVTQYDNAKLREKARRLGVHDFVLKENMLEVERIIQSYRN